MKITQQLSVVAIVVAAWTLCALGYSAGLLHGEVLMLSIAAVATLSMAVALVVVVSAAARCIVERQGAEVAEQRAEMAEHSARMQEIGAEIRTGMRENAHEISDRVITLEQWAALKARGAARAYIDAALEPDVAAKPERRAPDAEFWRYGSDTGPFKIAGN